MKKIADSELILNQDGSIYHLNLLPHEIANTIILVGDPDRTHEVSKHFDTITTKKQKREFITHTGTYNQHPISVVSTGIGTDNIDIVLNELDALTNVDFKTRTPKPNHTAMRLVRLGTAGALHPEAQVDSLVISALCCGFDALGHFYNNTLNTTEQQFQHHMQTFLDQHDLNLPFYVAETTPALVQTFLKHCHPGITLTWPGFYAPQGRKIRTPGKFPELLNHFQQLEFQQLNVCNFEMESAGIAILAKLLGHQCTSISTIMANRAQKTFSSNPEKAIDHMITMALEILCHHQEPALT
jgi:uridine phosphorylase